MLGNAQVQRLPRSAEHRTFSQKTMSFGAWDCHSYGEPTAAAGGCARGTRAGKEEANSKDWNGRTKSGESQTDPNVSTNGSSSIACSRPSTGASTGERGWKGRSNRTAPALGASSGEVGDTGDGTGGGGGGGSAGSDAGFF